MRHGRDERRTRPEPPTGTDRSPNRQLSGGFPVRSDNRFPPFLQFEPDSENTHSLFRQDEPLVMKRRVLTVVFLEELCDRWRKRQNRGELEWTGIFPAYLKNLTGSFACPVAGEREEAGRSGKFGVRRRNPSGSAVGPPLLGVESVRA
jgi:hypothetical protein